MSTTPNDNSFSLLMKGLAGLCEEIRFLRDDLYNHAVITNGSVFSTVVPLAGSRLFAVADMLPQVGAVTHEAYENKNDVAVAVLVHAEPVVTTLPPLGFSYSAAALFLTTRNSVSAAQAQRVHIGADTTVVLLQPGETLAVAVMAEGAVTVSWGVVPLRGRAMLRGYK